jgi:uncharacterized protein (TIGR02996 family)
MTNDGDALFRAVCENPADDTARLVYADWLDENGNPDRAEFIRLQCEASYISPAFPSEAARRARASQLLKEFGNQWYAEFPDLDGVVWGSLYVRGFIDSVDIEDARALGATLDSIFAAVPIRYLTVLDLRPGQLKVLLTRPDLSRLSRLRIPGTSGSEEGRLLTEARVRFPNTEIQ